MVQIMGNIVETDFTCTTCDYRGMLLQTIGKNEFICEECGAIFSLQESKYKIYLSKIVESMARENIKPESTQKETVYECSNCNEQLLQTVGENEFICAVCGCNFKLSNGKYAAYMSREARSILAKSEQLNKDLNNMADKFRKPEEIWRT